MPGIDNGDILFERRFTITEDITVKELYDLTEEQSRLLWKDHIEDIVCENYSPTPQKSLIKKRGTSIHYRNEINQLKVIDLKWSSEKIDRHLRATYMPGFPPPFARIHGKKVFLYPEQS